MSVQDIRAGEVGLEPIAAAMTKMRRVFASKPEVAKSADSTATATLAAGLACEILGPPGYGARTDMPAAAGGGESAPTPGWYLRAAMAACTATLTKMYAAEQGVVLDRVEVTVTSASDKRGMLGMGDVTAAIGDLRMKIRLAAAGVPETVLRELAERAQRNSPVGATLAAGDAGSVEIEIG
jgi:uncharacterized OsmC-like protein